MANVYDPGALTPSDFRIGNVLREKYSGTIVQIIELTSTIICVSGEFETGWQLEPVPLTESLLFQLGFKHQKSPFTGVFLYSTLAVTIYPEYVNKTICFKSIIRSGNATTEVNHKYIHELQNYVYAMLKEEISL